MLRRRTMGSMAEKDSAMLVGSRWEHGQGQKGGKYDVSIKKNIFVSTTLNICFSRVSKAKSPKLFLENSPIITFTIIGSRWGRKRVSSETPSIWNRKKNVLNKKYQSTWAICVGIHGNMTAKT